MKTKSHRILMIIPAAASALAALVAAFGFLMHFPTLAYVGFILHAAWFVAWGVSLMNGLIRKKVQRTDWKYCALTGGVQTVASATVCVAFLYAFADVLSNF